MTIKNKNQNLYSMRKTDIKRTPNTYTTKYKLTLLKSGRRTNQVDGRNGSIYRNVMKYSDTSQGSGERQRGLLNESALMMATSIVGDVMMTWD